jgi:hypothetical protein
MSRQNNNYMTKHPVRSQSQVTACQSHTNTTCSNYSPNIIVRLFDLKYLRTAQPTYATRLFCLKICLLRHTITIFYTLLAQHPESNIQHAFPIQSCAPMLLFYNVSYSRPLYMHNDSIAQHLSATYCTENLHKRTRRGVPHNRMHPAASVVV